MKFDFYNYFFKKVMDNFKIDSNNENNFIELINSYLGEFRKFDECELLINVVNNQTYSYATTDKTFTVMMDEKDYSDLDNELIYFSIFVNEEDNYFMARAIYVQDDNLLIQSIYNSIDIPTVFESNIENYIYTNVVNYLDFSKIDFNANMINVGDMQPDNFRCFKYESNNKVKNSLVSINDLNSRVENKIDGINPDSYNSSINLILELSDVYLTSIGLKARSIRTNNQNKSK